MAITMILDAGGLDPLDITPYIMQETDITEMPVYTEGPAAGMSKRGTPIHDRLQTLYNFTVPLIPAPQGVYAIIEKVCQKNEMQVTYTSLTQPTPVTMTGQCTFSQAGYVQTIERDGETLRIYAGPTITFEGWVVA